jgi:predicted  nucleic acid-binding Zn ribbon protein
MIMLSDISEWNLEIIMKGISVHKRVLKMKCLKILLYYYLMIMLAEISE